MLIDCFSINHQQVSTKSMFSVFKIQTQLCRKIYLCYFSIWNKKRELRGILKILRQQIYTIIFSSPGSHKGSMTITNYKLYFKATDGRKDCPLIVDVPLGFVNRIEKVGGQRISAGENAYGIDIYCKDIRTLRFALSKIDGHPRKNIFDTLRMFAFPLSNNCPLFAFQVISKVCTSYCFKMTSLFCEI